MFDNVDIVFIDGDGNMLPWFKKCDKVGNSQYTLTPIEPIVESSIQDVQSY